MKSLTKLFVGILLSYSAASFAGSQESNQGCDSSFNINRVCVKNGVMGVCSADLKCNIPVECSAQTHQQFCIYIDRTPKSVSYFRGICGTTHTGYACTPENDVNGDHILVSPLELGHRE